MVPQPDRRKRTTEGGALQNWQGWTSMRLLVGLLSAVVVYSADNLPKDTTLPTDDAKPSFCQDKAYGRYQDPEDERCYLLCLGQDNQNSNENANTGYRSCCTAEDCFNPPVNAQSFGSCGPCKQQSRGDGAPVGSIKAAPTPDSEPGREGEALSPIPTAPPEYFRLPMEFNSLRPVKLDPIPDWTEVQLQNAAFKVRVGQSAGGAITYISNARSNESVISRRDTGRFVQQSFYGVDDGTYYAGKSWVWNPVQGGSVDGSTGILLQLRNLSMSSVNSVAVPRNWGGNQVMIDATMETSVTLNANHIVMRNKLYYTGWRNQTYRDQELPAVFLTRRFDKLWLYNGTKPWTGKALQWLYPVTWEDVSKATATLLIPTEGWVAYQDSVTGEAVGVMSPSAIAAIAYRVGYANVGGPSDFATSYVAPIGRFGIKAGDTISYDVYITLGSVPYIRQVFTQIHNSLVSGAKGRG